MATPTIPPKTSATTTPGGRLPEMIVPPEVIPNLDELVIEDGKPVDNIYIEKQERLLAEALNINRDNWASGRPFQVFANVGLFFANKQDPLVPDVMLVVDARGGTDLDLRENRSYFLWVIGKPPDVVIEFVSDRRGREEDFKREQYERIAVPYYVIYDPLDRLHKGPLRAFRNEAGTYVPI
jgi:Uma2 family endonuclease